jgi:hypothetical protein
MEALPWRTAGFAVMCSRKAHVSSYELLSSFERGDDLGQPRVEAAQQLRATRIADPDPDDGTLAAQQLVHGEILLLPHAHYARFRSPRTNPRIRGALQTEVSYVFGVVA